MGRFPQGAQRFTQPPALRRARRPVRRTRRLRCRRHTPSVLHRHTTLLSILSEKDYTTDGVRAWILPGHPSEWGKLLVLALRSPTLSLTQNTDLFHLDGIGGVLRHEPLHRWLGSRQFPYCLLVHIPMAHKTIFDDPFCYELLVHIPTRGRILFNTVDYLTAARRLKMDLDGIHASLYDAEDIEQSLSEHHTSAWLARLKSVFNVDLVRRTLLPFRWMPVLARASSQRWSRRPSSWTP